MELDLDTSGVSIRGRSSSRRHSAFPSREGRYADESMLSSRSMMVVWDVSTSRAVDRRRVSGWGTPVSSRSTAWP